MQAGRAIPGAAGPRQSEEVMRIGRAIIIPAIVALGVAGTVLPGAEVAMAAGLAPAAHVHTAVTPSLSGVYYHS